MKACTSVFTASKVGEDLIIRSWRSWNRHNRRNMATWSAMVSWLSMLMPRLSTANDGLTRAGSSGSSVVVSLESCCHVSSHTSCVLSAFILRLLLRIQASMRSMQVMKRCVETNADAAGALMYTCVSSTYDESSTQKRHSGLKNRAAWRLDGRQRCRCRTRGAEARSLSNDGASMPTTVAVAGPAPGDGWRASQWQFCQRPWTWTPGSRLDDNF